MRTWTKVVGAMALVVAAATPGTSAAAEPSWRVDDVPMDAVLYDVASGGWSATWAVGALVGDNSHLP